MAVGSSFSLFNASQWQDIFIGVGLFSLIPIVHKLLLSVLFKLNSCSIHVKLVVQANRAYFVHQGKRREVHFDTDIALPDLSQSRARKIKKALFIQRAKTGRLSVRDIGVWGLYADSSKFDVRLLFIPTVLFIIAYLVRFSGLDGVF